MCNHSRLSFKMIRDQVRKHRSLRQLVFSWYDGNGHELFTHAQRYMLARLYFRAQGEMDNSINRTVVSRIS